MMEIILMSTWLSSITDSFANDVATAANTQIIARKVNYEGSVISFQHQFWRIRESSVCGPHAIMSQAFSECTVKARRMFSDMCEHLSSTQTNTPYHHNYQQMYCNAAVSFTPTIISISKGNPEELSEYQKLRIECNMLTASALGSQDEALIRQRDWVCSEFRSFKE